MEKADNTIALTEALDTSGIRTDLLSLAQTYVFQAMTDLGAEYFQTMRPGELLNACSRLMSVDVQVQKLKEDLRSKAAIEIKAIEGELDLTEDMLIQIRQRIYGIFD
jgi:hypothetical protein